MCVVSMVGDYYQEKFQQDYPFFKFYPAVDTTPIITVTTITREEFDALKKDVLEMKELLIRAKIYDEQNNQKDCEMESKVALLKQIAELVGVDVSKIFK